MVQTGTRYRERIAPVSPGQPTLAGNFYSINSVTGARQLIGPLYLANSLSSTSYERTWDQTNPGPPYQSGGDFTSCKAFLPQNAVVGSGVFRGYKYGTGIVEYVGGFGDPWVFDSIPNSDYINLGYNQSNLGIFPSLDPFSPLVYEKLRPRLESAGVFVALAEARDIPRMLRTSAHTFRDIWKQMGGSTHSRLMQPKRVADNFLNHQFGWVPFLSDIQRLYATYRDASVLSAKFSRSNNTWQKRVRTMQHVESEYIDWDSATSGGGYHMSPLIPSIQHPTIGPRYQIIRQVSTNVWCEGSFKYYRPEFDLSLSSYNSLSSGIQRDLMLYGARISPVHVWQATPWTWLVDWFTNAQDVIQRHQDWGQDSLAAKYMYLMHHQLRKLILRQTNTFYGGETKVFEWYRVLDIKRRRGTLSPYGFGLSWDALSPRQLAILAAIGISRSG